MHHTRIGMRRTTFWWVVSIVVHIALAAAIVFLTPVRKWLFEQSTDQVSMPDPDRAKTQKLLMTLNETYLRRMSKTATEMNTTIEELRRLRLARFNQLKSEAPQVVDQAVPTDPLKTGYTTKGQTIPQLFDFSLSGEETTIATYEQFRAYELAGIQFVPVSQTMRVTTMARPTRLRPNPRALDWQSIDNVRDGRFDAYKAALTEMDVEAKTALANATRLMEMAKGLMGEGEMAGVFKWELAGSDYAGTGAARFDENAPYIGPSLLPHERFASKGTSFEARPSFGTMITPHTVQAEWMSIDKWWIIGPFTHPGRENPDNLDQKYPPETLLDLDAKYIGKGGRVLNWRYTTGERVQIVPHNVDKYAIWYAYTEVYSDRDQTLWMAFGSDDYSKVWVNGKPIWASGKQPHQWIPDRGFAPVKLYQGINRIMVKLENAGGTTGFSVIISVDPSIPTS